MEEVPSTTSGKKTSIDDLPLEILSEVASHLEFVDILSLQQTTKKLRESTEARIVWLALTEAYSARHFHLYRPGTGTLDDIKTDELRAWIRKRLVVDQIWQAPHAVPRIRTLDHRDRHYSSSEIVFKLVPGGRWLLVLFKDGSVWYYDLNLSEPERLPLIPPSMFFEGPTKRVGNIAVFVDRDASGAGFKLALYRTELETDGDEHERGWLHVFQVELEDAKLLVADRLTSIPCDHGHIEVFALGSQFMVCEMSRIGSRSWIEGIWWKQCSVAGDLRTRFYIEGGKIGSIYLVGDDRILCSSASSGVVNVYALPEPEHTDGFELDDIPSPEPLWSHSFGRGAMGRSPISYDGATYRLVVSTWVSIWGLVLPASNDDNPSIIELSNLPIKYGLCVPGIRKAYVEAFREGGAGARIGYSWDGGDGIPAMNYSNKGRKAVAHGAISPTFDEESGRLVYIPRTQDSDLMVVDFLHKFEETP